MYTYVNEVAVVESFKDKQEIKEKLSETLSALYSLELPEELKPAAIQRSDVQGRLLFVWTRNLRGHCLMDIFTRRVRGLHGIFLHFRAAVDL